MVLADFRQRITREGWQGENSAGVGKTLSRVRSGSQIAPIHNSVFLPWSILLGAALHTIWIPRMLEFLLSIVDTRSFLDVMLTCKPRLVLLYCITILSHFTRGRSIFLLYLPLILRRFDNYLQDHVFRATCGFHLTEYYWV
jgi:hypothetical protein